jgi:hypothetical protein
VSPSPFYCAKMKNQHIYAKGASVGNYKSNKFDGSLALRVTIASLICPFPIVLLVLLGPTLMALLGGLPGMILTMILCCLVIALVAELLKLVPFPLVTVMKDDTPPSDLEIARTRLWHTFSALPLSFAAALLWTVSAALSLEYYAAPIMLIIVSPMTIAFLILHLDSETAAEALRKSLRTFILMLLVSFMFSPEPAELDSVGAADNASDSFPR